jgi:uncharacterized protein (TIGR02466 family)
MGQEGRAGMAFDEPEVRVLFPVPLVTIRLQRADALNARLLAEIGQRRQGEAGVDRSNRYGWHSALDFFDRPEPAHCELAQEIEAMVASVTQRLVPDLPAGLRAVHEGWVNVSPNNAMNAPHDHPGSFWSGTYYVHVPQPDEADRQSGAIEFIDPRGSIGSSAGFETPFTRGKFTARPTAGSCFIWPSFVKHWVHPNRADEDRVSVAFNSRFTRAK